MHAEFTGTCKACEYRQLVRGYYKQQVLDGTWQTFFPELSKTTYLNETDFQEDGVNVNGKYLRPGHRHDAPVSASTSPTGYFYDPADVYSPNRKTGCKYDSVDHVTMIRPKNTYKAIQVHLEVKGQIVEVNDNGDVLRVVKETGPWTIDFSAP
jgi:hypothetical protein